MHLYSEIDLLDFLIHFGHLRTCIVRYIVVQDKKWFEDTLTKVAKEEFGESYAGALSAEHFFVDFLRDPEEAGTESVADMMDDSDFEMPHVYETIQSWESLKDRLYYFMHQYNEQV